MLDPGGNVHHIAGVQLLGLLAPLLIVATPGHTDQHLTAALGGVVDVPVVAATGFKGHIEHPHLAGGQGVQIALPHEILGKAIVGRTDGEDHLLLMLGLAVCVIFLRPHLFGHAEGGPSLGPAGVEGGVGENLGNFLPGDAVLLGGGQVILEGAVHQPLGHEGHHGDQGAVPKGEFVLTAPHLSKQYIVIQLGKLGGKLTQSVPACGLLYCHVKGLLYTKYAWKKLVILSKGMMSFRSYRSVWTASGMMSNSLLAV